MRSLYYYKLRVFPRNSLSYTVSDYWKPEDCLKYSKFFQAALFMEELHISPQEYLCAIIEYRKVNLRRDVFLDEDMMSGFYAQKALEIFIFNRRESNINYMPSSFFKIQDPEQEKQKFYQNRIDTWVTITEVSSSNREALMKIFASDLRVMFEDESFFQNIPEFQEMKAEKSLRVNPEDGYIYYYL